MSEIFFESFSLPKPHHHLNIENRDGVDFSANAILELARVFRVERPSCVLAYGDVNSTLSAAIASAKLGIPFAHVEGGIRSGDRHNQEEVNRRVSDTLADLIFCVTETAVDNLKREGCEANRIALTGDLMKDVLLRTLKSHSISPTRGDYMVLTLHRQENVTDRARFRKITEGLLLSGKNIVFPAHPRTLQCMRDFGILDLIRGSLIEIRPPASYVDFVNLIAGADKILTDSGGVRREAYWLKKPCIVLIEISWFPEISKTGWKVLTGPDPARIADLICNFEPLLPHQELFGDGKAHEQIVESLIKRYDKPLAS